MAKKVDLSIESWQGVIWSRHLKECKKKLDYEVCYLERLLKQKGIKDKVLKYELKVLKWVYYKAEKRIQKKYAIDLEKF